MTAEQRMWEALLVPLSEAERKRAEFFRQGIEDANRLYSNWPTQWKRPDGDKGTVAGEWK